MADAAVNALRGGGFWYLAGLVRGERHEPGLSAKFMRIIAGAAMLLGGWYTYSSVSSAQPEQGSGNPATKKLELAGGGAERLSQSGAGGAG